MTQGRFFANFLKSKIPLFEREVSFEDQISVNGNSLNTNVFLTVILPRFKLHLSVEKLKYDTMMPTFPPLQFYDIIVTEYQLRLTDALGGASVMGD